MTVTAIAPAPPFIGLPMGHRVSSFRRFTVAEYHKLIQIGLLTEDDDLELLDGHLVKKMSRNAPHDGTIDLFRETIGRLLPAGWMLRCQQAVTLPTSEPEPDYAVVRGNVRAFTGRHPGVAEVGVIVEIADSTLDFDRKTKAPVYGHAGIAEYWIVNIPDRQVEVYTHPSGPNANPGYAVRTDFAAGQAVPFALAGQVLANVAVDDLLP